MGTLITRVKNRRLLGLWLFFLIATSGLLLQSWFPQQAAAQNQRIDYLVGLLESSTHFRVRVQAALSLGQAQTSPKVMQALGKALQDGHPAVRAAAVSSIERHGDASMLLALRSLKKDRNLQVRSAVLRAIRTLSRVQTARQGSSSKPTYYVGIAVPSSQTNLSAGELRMLQDYLRQQVSELPGVVLAPNSENKRNANRIMRQRGLEGYYLDSSIVSLEPRGQGALRAEVSLIVSTYPGRDMRATLSGAATAQGQGDQEQNRRMALEAAYSGALRRLTTVLQAASRR